MDRLAALADVRSHHDPPAMCAPRTRYKHCTHSARGRGSRSLRSARSRRRWHPICAGTCRASSTAPASGVALLKKLRRRVLAESVRDRLQRAQAGGPSRHREKLAGQRKLMPRERIRLLFDPDTHFVEDGLLAGTEDPEL